jgi:hypothetical protein
MEGEKWSIKEKWKGVSQMSQRLEITEELSWDIVWETIFGTDIFYHPYLMGAVQ